MEWIADILNWIASNPTWAGLMVMAIAFAESLALVGLFLPGAVMMFGIGALVGSGAMALWPTLIWAAAGAIAGDGVSFWLGRHFHQRIRVMWPFRTHPALLNQSIQFFHRHGGKSVLLGRFIGPIRPVIPVVAGMMEMAPRRFYLVNVISGVLWAPVYVLPGMVFATSLGLAAEAATRLAVIAGTLLMVVMISVWLLRHTLDWFHRHTYLPLRRLLGWSRLHPIAGEIPQALLNPNHPEARGLTLLALLLLFAATGLAALWSQLGPDSLLAHLDDYLFNTLQALRTPLADRFMVNLTLLAAPQVVLPLASVVALWLGWQRRWHTLFHWLAALLFIVSLEWLLHQLVSLPRPPTAAPTPFPSGHTGYSVVLFGFLAVVIGHELERQRWRLTLYSVVAVVVSLIAFSRLYLGGDWLSDILGEAVFGLLWVALLALAYHHHPTHRLAIGRLLLLVAITSVTAYSWHRHNQFEVELGRYAGERQIESISLQQWWQEGWRQLPRQRIDLRDYRNHPLTLHYAGEITPLREALLETGWREPEQPDLINWIKWLGSTTPIAELPVMPQVHDGYNEALLLVRDAPDNTLWSLRLWTSPYRLQPGHRPLWIGNLGQLAGPEDEALFYAPRTVLDFGPPSRLLAKTLAMLPQPFVARRVSDPHGSTVWLVQHSGN